MALDITVDLDRCVGSRMCVNTTPAVFGLDEAGQSTVVDASGADHEAVVDAAAQCPLEAIRVATEDGTQLFP